MSALDCSTVGDLHGGNPLGVALDDLAFGSRFFSGYFGGYRAPGYQFFGSRLDLRRQVARPSVALGQNDSWLLGLQGSF